MYSNDTTQIRQGLTNYTGALINSIKLPNKAARQQVVAILMDEVFKLSKDDDGLADLYVVKPFLLGTIKILHQRISELEKVTEKATVEDTLNDYNQVAKFFTNLVQKIGG